MEISHKTAILLKNPCSQYMHHPMKLILFVLLLIKTDVLYSSNHCNAMFRIRAPDDPTCLAVDGCMPNSDPPTSANYRPRIPYHAGFMQIINKCQKLCILRGTDCRGYITGNFIDDDESRNPEEILKKIMPSYSKESDGINNPTHDVDCICIGAEYTNEQIDQHYTELQGTLIKDGIVLNMLHAIVAFWVILHGHLSSVLSKPVP